MAVKVEVTYAKAVPVEKSVGETYAFCADLEQHIPKTFPGLQAFTKVEPGVYRWTFKKISYGGNDIELKLVTRFTFEEPSRISITPMEISGPGQSRFTGEWRFESAGDKAKIVFNTRLEAELPLPFFLKAMIGPLAQRELSNLFDRYLNNVAQALSK